MAVPGFYRRVLPSPPAIDFASAEGKQLFYEALQNGTMEGFFKLISHFQTQSEPAYCGLASLAMVLNALAIDPGRKWKGVIFPLRISLSIDIEVLINEALGDGMMNLLDCCEPLEKIQVEGTTFGKVACLGRCAGANVEAFRTNQSNIDDFRNHIKRCTSSADCHLIASYNRQHFKQTGTGHFSPIGGYHAGSDTVLILDVARFKYPPHWVPLPLLWEAMNTIDKATGRYRGFMLISRLEKAPSLLYTLSCKNETWISMVKYLVNDVPTLLKSESLRSVSEVLLLLLRYLPTSAGDFVKWVAEVRRQEGDSALSQEEKGRLAMKEEVLQEVRKTELFKSLKDLLSSATSCCSDLSSKQDNESLSEIAANVCCQGAAFLSGRLNPDTNFCCRATCVKCLRVNGDKPATVISSTVVAGGNEHGVDMLVPVSTATPETSYCDVGKNILMHPGGADVLTVLLLALPHNIWFDVKDENLLAELCRLTSTENLMDIIQQEVLHLRRQLHFLQKCGDEEEDP